MCLIYGEKKEYAVNENGAVKEDKAKTCWK